MHDQIGPRDFIGSEALSEANSKRERTTTSFSRYTRFIQYGLQYGNNWGSKRKHLSGPLSNLQLDYPVYRKGCQCQAGTFPFGDKARQSTCVKYLTCKQKRDITALF